MGMIKKSITVTDQQNAWIQTQMASGNFATDSEVIRDAIRAKQMHSQEIEEIRAALLHAESRGVSKLGKDSIKQSVLQDMKKNGEL